MTVRDNGMVLSAVPDLEPTMLAAVDATITALNCPPADAAVVALARKVARVIDVMPDGQAGMMLGQTAPLLLKTLQELEDRSRKRRSGSRGSAPSGVAKLRAAHAQSVAKRTRAG